VRGENVDFRRPYWRKRSIGARIAIGVEDVSEYFEERDSGGSWRVVYGDARGVPLFDRVVQMFRRP